MRPTKRSVRRETPQLAPLGGLLLLMLLPGTQLGAQTPAANQSFIDDQGQTHITRVVPLPTTISAEAQAKLAKPSPSILTSGASVAEQREKIGARQQRDAEAWLKIYPANIAEAEIAGVPVHIVTPKEPDPATHDRVLVNLHGGGFRTDTGSLLESIPIAHLTHMKVISVLYRLAPENPFPAGLDDAIHVYRELLKTYRPENIGIYGTSAGAILTAEAAAKIKQLGLPLPAALGIFSGLGDFSRPGDSMALFGLQGLAGVPLPHGQGAQSPEYAGKTDPKDPILSPVFADLHSMPPTLFITSTRDMLLSGTVLLHQEFLRAGVDARLVVFEALPHAFWLDVQLPESRAANDIMARFLTSHIGK